MQLTDATKSKRIPKVSIGLPVYNAENSIKQSIDSILRQTFCDFEVIVSDNCSTDNTQQICEEYSRNDKRIRYIKQKVNIGPFPNFYFTLNQARYEYFVWLAADDFWEPNFLKKNVEALESNQNLVGSISEVDFYGKGKSRYDRNFTKENFPRYRHVHPISGTWDEKAAFCLKFLRATMIYAVYRTDKLKNSILSSLHPRDLFIILNVLKYGNLHVIDEILMHRYAEGLSSKPFLRSLRQQNMQVTQIIFMYVPFMSWCIRNFGLGFILKNIRNIFKLHCIGYGRLLLDVLRS